MSKQSIEILEACAALEIGIIPPSIMRENPDAMKDMNSEDCKVAKRKFRKIKRKLAKICPFTGKKLTKNVTQRQVAEYLLEKANTFSFETT